MLHRLRQITFAVENLAQAQHRYESWLGMPSVYHSNTPEAQSAVLYAGDGTFVELHQPLTPDTAAARHLAARGPGPFELIFDTNDFTPLIARLKNIGVKTSEPTQWFGVPSIALPPESTHGARLRIVEHPPSGRPPAPTGNPTPSPPQPPASAKSPS